MKRLLSWLLALLAALSIAPAARAEELAVSAQACMLMEKTTGQVLYAVNEHQQLEPASVTKVMTMLLVMEAIDSGSLAYEDTVTASAYACSMGGSQIWLKENEQMTVEDMLKAVCVVSANDCSVALAEHVAGSAEAFVERMNQRAAELGMADTHFENPTGLPAPGHVTSAHDIAVMSRELILRHPDIRRFTTIWMDTLRGGESGLSNTNKLIRGYEGCVGLKTGSTSIAKYCVSTVAVRGGITLISVVMTAPDYKVRFRDAAAMLDYGFARCTMFVDEHTERLKEIPVKKTVRGSVSCNFSGPFYYLDTEGRSMDNMEKEIHMKKSLTAPVKAGDEAGEAVYMLDGQEVGRMKVVAAEDVPSSGYLDYLIYICMQMVVT